MAKAVSLWPFVGMVRAITLKAKGADQLAAAEGQINELLSQRHRIGVGCRRRLLDEPPPLRHRDGFSSRRRSRGMRHERY